MKLIGERGIEPPFRRNTQEVQKTCAAIAPTRLPGKKVRSKRPRPPIWDAAYYAMRLRGIRDKLCHNLTRTAMITDSPSKP